MQVNKFDVFSFLLSDSRYLNVYCSKDMCWITRKHPFGKAQLIDTGQIVDFSKETTAKDVVTVIASHPLTDNEEWVLMQPKSLEVV